VAQGTSAAAYLDGYRFAAAELRSRRHARGWSLERLAAEFGANGVAISRVSLGEIERQVCRAAPELQAVAAAVLQVEVGELFEPEEERKLRRQGEQGDYVRQRVACEILGVTKQGIRYLERDGVVTREAEPPFEYRRSALEELVPPGSVTLPELAKRTGLHDHQVRLRVHASKLDAFRPWPGGNYRVLPHIADRFVRENMPRELKVARARELRLQGESYEAIADNLGVTYPTARTWTMNSGEP